MNAYDRDRVQLLFGPYRPPHLRVGDRATCLLRDCPVVITSITDAPIPWPRCRALGGGRGGSGLWLGGDLEEAIRQESAAAVRYWWGLSVSTVWKMRKALSVTRTNNEGTQRLVWHAAIRGAEAVKAREWTDEERAAKRRLNAELNLGRNLRLGYHGPRWTKPLQVAAPGGAAPGGGSQQRAQVVVGFMVIPPPPWCCRRTSNRPPLAPDFHRWRGRGTMPAAGCGSGDLAVGWQRTEMSAGWGGANY